MQRSPHSCAWIQGNPLKDFWGESGKRDSQASYASKPGQRGGGHVGVRRPLAGLERRGSSGKAPGRQGSLPVTCGGCTTAFLRKASASAKGRSASAVRPRLFSPEGPLGEEKPFSWGAGGGCRPFTRDSLLGRLRMQEHTQATHIPGQPRHCPSSSLPPTACQDPGMGSCTSTEAPGGPAPLSAQRPSAALRAGSLRL